MMTSYNKKMVQIISNFIEGIPVSKKRSPEPIPTKFILGQLKKGPSRNATDQVQR